MAFQLDTSGEVGGRVTGDMYRRGYKLGPLMGRAYCWSDLTPFQQGYVEGLLRATRAAIHAETLPGSRARYNYATSFPAFSDLAPETLARIIEDCRWVRETMVSWRLPVEGAAFWRHRNAGWSEVVSCRQQLCDRFPPLAPYLGDDGRVYLREGA